MTRRAVSGGRLLVVAFLTATLGLLGAGTALAHNAVTGSTPGDGQEIDAGPAQVTLSFDQVVQNYQPLVTVVGPDGSHWESSPVTVLNNEVTAPLNPLGPAGVYTIAFRVISADGHAVEGTSRFTLTTPGTGTPNASASPSGTVSNSIPAWVWILGAGLVIATVAISGRLGARRRRIKV